MEETTHLLRAWSAGNAEAGEELFERLYADLRRVAARRRSAEPPGALDTTALVHEAYLRLVDQKVAGWRDRAQFFAVAARVMRRVLVDDARRRRAQKRGGEVRKVRLEDLGEVSFGERPEGILALETCLAELETFDAHKARLVELRFFAGLSLEQTAEVLETSRATVVRQWRMTKGWLHRRLESAPPGPA